MASQSDNTVNERRLRPIYDCLDNGNNKKALQEVDKLLRKHKDLQCARGLKALALLRLGRTDQANAILTQLHTEMPTDESTLQAITICYKDMHKPECIAEIYEAACRKEPNNEELLSHLFVAYVRLSEYKKQQKTAMALYKLKPKSPYYFWAVMSIVMQTYSVTEDVAASLLLPLAERMVEKYAMDHGLDSEAEVQLYLMILEMQKKYEAALDLVTGTHGVKLRVQPNLRDVKQGQLLRKLERWREVNGKYRLLLIDQPDHWQFYEEYFNSAFKLIGNSQDIIVDDLVDDSLSKVVDFLAAQLDAVTKEDSQICRGPFLARIHLKSILIQKKLDIGVLPNLVHLISDYFKHFGEKPCCYPDLRFYLNDLTENEKDILDNLLREEMGLVTLEEPWQLPGTSKGMQSHISYTQVSRALGKHQKMTVEKRKSLVKELIDRYKHGIPFGEGLTATEVRPNDPYALLAAHLLLDISQETNSVKELHQAVILLEDTLKFSPSNHQVKLLLIRLYNALGCIYVSVSLFEYLDVKHIIYDTLGYLISHHLVTKACFRNASMIYANMVKFYTANYKDTLDYIIHSYRYGSFTKIPEFIRFRQRICDSVQFAMVVVDRLILDLVLDINTHTDTEHMMEFMDVDPEKDNQSWEDLKDNRDFEVMSRWDPTDLAFTDTVAASMRCEVMWLRFRNLLVRSVASVHLMLKSTSGLIESKNVEMKEPAGYRSALARLPAVPITEKSENQNGVASKSQYEILLSVTSDFQKLMNELKGENFQLPSVTLQGPEVSRIENYSRYPFMEILASALDCAVTLQSYVMEQTNGLTNHFENRLEDEILSKIRDCGMSIVNQLEASVFNPLNSLNAARVLEDAYNLIETLSFLAIICGYCQRVMSPTVKKGKKKKDANTSVILPSSVISSFTNLVTGLETVTLQVYNRLHATHVDVLSYKMDTLTLDTGGAKDEIDTVRDIVKKMVDSYSESLKNLVTIAENKMKYFASLKV